MVNLGNIQNLKESEKNLLIQIQILKYFMKIM